MKKSILWMAVTALAPASGAAWNTGTDPFTVLPLQQSRPENMHVVTNGESTFSVYTINQDGKTDLYLQMIDLAGNPVFEAPGKKVNYGDGPDYASGGVGITSTADGGVLVMYGDTRNDPDGYKQEPFIYKIDASGDVVSAPEGIALPDAFDGRSYALIADGDDVVALYDVNAEGTYTAYTHLCRLDASGSPLKSVVLGGGNATVQVSDKGLLCAYTLNNSLSAQLYDRDLSPVWSEPKNVHPKTAMWGVLTSYPDGKGGMYIPYEYTDENYNSFYPMAHISAEGDVNPQLLASMSPKDGFMINESRLMPVGDGFCMFTSIRDGYSGPHYLYAATYSSAGELKQSKELGQSADFMYEFPAAHITGTEGHILLETVESQDYSTQYLVAREFDAEFNAVWEKTLVQPTGLSQVNTIFAGESFTNYYVDAPTYDSVGIFGLRLDYAGIPVPADVSTCQLDIVLTKPGTLSSKVTAEQKYTTESMRIRGRINSDDVRFIRDMAGVKDIQTETPGILSQIDLSGATVVEGGQPYMSYYDTDIWEDVELSTSYKVFPAYFFNRCSVTKVLMPVNTVEIGRYAFGDCGILTSVDIPESVQSIGANAFGGSGLTKAKVPEAVTVLGAYAFWGCANLTEISLPDNFTMLPEGLFQQTAINEYTLGPRVVRLGGNVFKDCQNLEGVDGTERLEQIDRYAFNNCLSLDHITFGPALTSIGIEAFANCAMLPDVRIPASVEWIGSLAFSNCQKMSSIEVEAGNKNYKSADGILYSADGLTVITSPAGHADAIVIPDGVTTIGASCFEAAVTLTEVTLPASVTTVENEAFKFCTSLEKLHCAAAVPPSVGWRDVFLGVPVATCELEVPAGTEEAYKAADGWKEFTKISSGIENVAVSAKKAPLYYGIDGVRRGPSQSKGVLIRRTADGRTSKVVIR